ncbi:adhesion G protein-coupled receptor E3-like [Dendropsophus ebraccatus]|uniref:adhesion G protein-coupled receptor E3-like n=1 Tax=Dendropsophus ebraccatus TaxID=150705 RepID=UPI0038320D39
MQTSGRLLLYGLCWLLSCCTVRGIRIIPNEAIHFTKCNPFLNQCPANSTCEETNHGDYCACHSTHYNDKDKLTITYPGGECLEFCEKEGKPFPCSCKAGYISKQNEKGLYVCTDKCTDDSDCPTGATCTASFCYCKECRQQQGNSCVTLVKFNEVCGVPTTTKRPSLTSHVTIRSTAATTPQPVLSSTAATTEPHHIPFTSSTEAVLVTSHKTSEEPESPTTQPDNDKCQIKSRTEQECENHTNKDTVCMFLKSIVNIKEEACKSNITNTVKKVASQITDLLNQTSLETLNLPNLQKVVVGVIENVETSLLASFSTDPRNEQINSSEIEAEMKTSHDYCDEGSSIILTVNDNTMEVPCSLVHSVGGGAMFISYRGLNSRLNGSILAALGDSDNTATEMMSPMVGGAIIGDNTENLDPPVTFSLKHLMAVKPFHDVRCVFWDTKNDVWSTRGCTKKTSAQENTTICVCTHLSTFALLMAPTEIQEDTGLRLISIIGLSISLVCLLLSFLTFSLCRSLRSAHTSILMVLCGCLFLGQLLVLVGLEQTSNKILCSVIAGSLQLIFLCAFCWMSLESFLLFLTVRNLQALNFMKSQRSYFPYLCLIGFGIPVIIMVISASLYPHVYGGETHCWLKVSHVWSFLGPVCMFISVNFTLLVLTFCLLKKKLASLNSNVSTLKHTRLLAFKALSQLLILGCTWIIGLFQFGSGSIVASYIFTICNSLQGVYIFIVHCLLNRQVWEEYSRGFRRFSKKPTSETLSGSTVPMTLKTVSSQVSEAGREDGLGNLKNQKC